MIKTILILIGGHFALAPRPQKEAAAAKAAGFTVEVRGCWWDEMLAAEDLELAQRMGVTFKPMVDFRPSGPGARNIRVRQRLARELFNRLGIATARSFGMGGPEILREAISLAPDFIMVHSEAGLWVAKRLLAKGFRVGVDFEDWFSEDLPVSDRKGRPVRQLKKLERYLIKNAHLTLATTQVMANALAQDARSEHTPLAIPNSFPIVAEFAESVRGDARAEDTVSFYWFSQTIGPGRGLEALAKAITRLNGKWELHLRGNLRGYDHWFEEHFPDGIRSKVHLHPCVSNEHLPHHSASHDVGLALEIPHCPSRDLTATNKIFEYLRCGLAVIASATQGQVEVMNRCPRAGWVVPPDDIEAIIKAMQECIDDRRGLSLAKRAAREAAGAVWAWQGFHAQLGAALVACMRGEETIPEKSHR